MEHNILHYLLFKIFLLLNLQFRHHNNNLFHIKHQHLSLIFLNILLYLMWCFILIHLYLSFKESF